MAETTRQTPEPFRGPSIPTSSGNQGRPGGGRAFDAKDIGSELLGAVQEGATTLFEQQRNRAADEIAALGDALRRSAQALDESGGGTVAQYAGQAAQQIDDFAETLRHRTWTELAGDFENFAQRWPIAFMAAAVGVGFVAGRLLVGSSGRPSEPAAQSGAAFRSGEEPRGGARYDYGAVSGSAAGTANSGYGAAASRETG